MGVATILEAREICLLATGEHKVEHHSSRGRRARSIARSPRRFLQRHHDASPSIATPAAAAELTRIATPWLVGRSHWTPELELRAVIWLSLSVGARHPQAHRERLHRTPSASLLCRHGTAGAVNGMVFNATRCAHIRGRLEVAEGQRVICFSPAPRRRRHLAWRHAPQADANGNDIVRAYRRAATSPSSTTMCSVLLDCSSELRRMFIWSSPGRHPGRAGQRNSSPTSRLAKSISAEVLDLKRIIREAEAVSGIESIGLHRDRARFLNLPFYRTGKVKKDPSAGRRGAGARVCSRRSGPISSSSPATSPTRTAPTASAWTRSTRRCGAISRGQGGPEVWLYRGAWQEWTVTEADMAVPLAQEELHHKIQAIFKHQTQKDSAPFPGLRRPRVLAAGRGAQQGDRGDRRSPGLAEYFAMEAYVVA